MKAISLIAGMAALSGGIETVYPVIRQRARGHRYNRTKGTLTRDHSSPAQARRNAKNRRNVSAQSSTRKEIA